jgi:hypothetical protein
LPEANTGVVAVPVVSVVVAVVAVVAVVVVVVVGDAVVSLADFLLPPHPAAASASVASRSSVVARRTGLPFVVIRRRPSPPALRARR